MRTHRVPTKSIVVILGNKKTYDKHEPSCGILTDIQAVLDIWRCLYEDVYMKMSIFGILKQVKAYHTIIAIVNKIKCQWLAKFANNVYWTNLPLHWQNVYSTNW